jgi:transposase-like protein
VDRDAIVRDRLSGSSLTATAKKHGVSRASVVRFVHEAQRSPGPVGQLQHVPASAAVELAA